MCMLVTCVCATCTKVNIMVVNSGMIAEKMFYPNGWNILYSSDSPKSQAVSLCSKDCMQLNVNKTKVPNVWITPDGKQTDMKPMAVH